MTEGTLGAAVRRIREERGLSLRGLAELTGFSASFMSQVENGQASPSISSMERIAAALGVTPAEFFATQGGGRKAIIRAGDRPMLESKWSRARIEALAGGDGSMRLEAVLVTMQPEGSSGKRAYASLREEFALVLDGSVELTLGETEQTLSSGDAVAIHAGAFRRWYNGGSAPARILIVTAR